MMAGKIPLHARADTASRVCGNHLARGFQGLWFSLCCVPMPDAFKNLINTRTVADTATHLHAAWPAFDRPRFDRLAGQGWEALEMNARAMQIAEALDACLPADFKQAAAIIEKALAPAGAHGGMVWWSRWDGWRGGRAGSSIADRAGRADQPPASGASR